MLEKNEQKQMKHNNLEYLIAGTGGSGTHACSITMQSAGIACGWECIFTHKGWDTAEKRLRIPTPISMPMKKMEERYGCVATTTTELRAETAFPAVPFLDKTELSEVKKVLILRDPMRTASSCLGLKLLQPHHSFYPMAKEFVPHTLSYDPYQLDAYASYWISWHKLAQKKCPTIILHKIEDGPESLLNKLGIEIPSGVMLFRGHTNSHTPSHATFNLLKDKDLAKELSDYASQFGYIM